MFFAKIKNRLSSADGRTRNVLKNTVAVAAMKAGSLGCSLIMVPITLNYLDAENYGIWMAMTSILYWFAFFDVGLGNGMRNYLAAAISQNDYVKARAYFSTAIFLLSIIAVIIGVLSVAVVFNVDLNALLNTQSIDGHTLAVVLMVAISFSLVQFVAKNIGMVYVAMQKYAVNEFITFIGQLVSAVAIYIITKTTEPNLLYIVLAITSVPGLMFIIAAIPLIRKYPELKPNIKSIDTSSAKKIVGKGLGFFIIQIMSCLVVFGSANVIISHYCGPEQVTVYNISYKIFNVLVILYTIVLSPLWNAYTDAAVKGDYGWIKRTYRKSIMMWLASVAGGLLVLAVSGWLFDAWVGDSVTIPFEVSACVLLYVCSFNFANCTAYLLNGLNKIRVQIILSIVSTVIYLAVVLSFSNKYGIIGITLSMAAIYIIKGIIYIYQARLLVNQKATGIWNK